VPPTNVDSPTLHGAGPHRDQYQSATSVRSRMVLTIDFTCDAAIIVFCAAPRAARSGNAVAESDARGRTAV
jgi:hypothetical protein